VRVLDTHEVSAETGRKGKRMAWRDLDDGAWEDDSECIVCKADMGKSQALICSATCEDLFAYGSSRSVDLENDCYA
jgi:hypothetical protein